MILISASAPGTTGAAAPQPTYPAVYRVTLDRAAHDRERRHRCSTTRTRRRRPTSRSGPHDVQLVLTDPDSNEDVPFYAPASPATSCSPARATSSRSSSATPAVRPDACRSSNLSDSVDDTAWPSGRVGRIYTTDNSNNTVNAITGPFFAAARCSSPTRHATRATPRARVPGPGFPANFLGELDPWTGLITPVDLRGPAVEPQGGMLFLPFDR